LLLARWQSAFYWKRHPTWALFANMPDVDFRYFELLSLIEWAFYQKAIDLLRLHPA